MSDAYKTAFSEAEQTVIDAALELWAAMELDETAQVLTALNDFDRAVCKYHITHLSMIVGFG